MSNFNVHNNLNREVSISLAEYRSLIELETKYDLLTDALIKELRRLKTFYDDNGYRDTFNKTAIEAIIGNIDPLINPVAVDPTATAHTAVNEEGDDF